MSTSNISDNIQRAIVAQNRGFGKVIDDVADGFRRCGFFNHPSWKVMLLQGFERKRSDPATGDIIYNTMVHVHTSVMYDDSFQKGMTAQSTPIAAGRIVQKDTQTPRNKRRSTSTLPVDGRQSDTQGTGKIAKISTEEIEAAKILVDLKQTDWGRILPAVNEKQNAVKYVDAFEISKRLRVSRTPLQNEPAENVNATQTSSLRDQNQPATRNSIPKRPNAIYKPNIKRPADSVADSQQGSVAVTQPASNRFKKAKTTNAEASVPTDPPNNVLTNITNRRLTRKQSQLLAAYSGSNSAIGLTPTNITERRATGYFQRTSVLFTMIDTAQYKNILQQYNIFVADINEKYDYVITERICRSAKFLSAVVSGKPILSIEWLRALDEKKVWLDPLTYLLKDDDGEKEFGFDLSATLLKATNKRLFDNYSILVTAHTTISPELLKGVIFSGGGKFLKTTLVPRRGDEVICISDEADRKTWPTLCRKYPTLRKIITLDGFSKMIFQYTHDVSPADVLHQI